MSVGSDAGEKAWAWGVNGAGERAQPCWLVPVSTGHSSHLRGTSLVVQWLRICLPMQGTQVQSLTLEDATRLRASKPVHYNQ